MNASKFRLGFVLCTVGLIATSCVDNEEFFIPDDNFNDFATIQEAIDFAQPGDTIFLESGIYSPSTNGENFPIFMKDGVSLKGEDPSNTIIDAEGTDYIFDVFNFGGFIDGFTLRNGFGERGGAIFVQNSNIHLENLLIVANRAVSAGSGIYIKDSDDSTLQNLSVVSNARAASSTDSPAQIEVVGTTLNFYNNTVAFGDNDGLRLTDSSSGNFENNIFSENGSEGQGAGMADTDAVTTAFIQYNITFDNIVADYFLNGTNLSSTEANDLFADDQIANNFSADPLFTDPENADFTPGPGSPAINAGDPAAVFNNTDGTRNTIGVTGGPWAI